MRLDRSLLLVPAASSLLAVGLGSGACSSGTGIPGGTIEVPIVAIGSSSRCVGEVYYAWDGAYVACEDGEWAYEPAGWDVPAGYELVQPYGSGDGGSDDSGTSHDSGRSSDAG